MCLCCMTCISTFFPSHVFTSHADITHLHALPHVYVVGQTEQTFLPFHVSTWYDGRITCSFPTCLHGMVGMNFFCPSMCINRKAGIVHLPTLSCVYVLRQEEQTSRCPSRCLHDKAGGEHLFALPCVYRVKQELHVFLPFLVSTC